jgi:peroxiredoxin Q/BCP
MAELQVGDKAPAFELPAADGGTVRLSELAGKPAVLYFYPQDDTETCTAEAIGFSSLHAEFSRLGVPVIGVSPDSLERHEKFIRKHGLVLVLASDRDLQASRAYGVWSEKTLFGRTYMGVTRTTFLIGPEGDIVRIWRKVRVRGHPEQVLAAVSEMAHG